MRKLRLSSAASLILIAVVAVGAGIAWLTSRPTALTGIAGTQGVMTSREESSDSVEPLDGGSTRATSADKSTKSRASEGSDGARASNEHQSNPNSSTSQAFGAAGKSTTGFGFEDDLKSANTHAEVGQSFPVSRSMKSQCKRNPVPSAESCARVFELIDEMAQEPRDEIWAQDVEAKLRTHVLHEHPTARIRALECRTSLCAIEVASETGHLVILGEEEQRNCGIYDNSHVSSSFETGPSGSKVTVTLRVFERR